MAVSLKIKADWLPPKKLLVNQIMYQLYSTPANLTTYYFYED